MGALRLLIDRGTIPLWDKDQRRALLNASDALLALEWTVDPTAGGCGRGTATLDIEKGTPAYEFLVERGLSGVAWIWWNRDPNESDTENAETDLLWLGMAEDARAIDGSPMVKISLRGAGAWLDETRFSGAYAHEKIATIAADILQAAIDAGDSPIKAKEVDTTGVLQRRVSVAFDETTTANALEELQKLAGGPSMVGFGVGPAADQDNYGTAFFRQWQGHLWAKSALATPRRLFSLSESQLVEVERSATSRSIRNVVTVIGREIPGSGGFDTAPSFYTGTAEAGESIARYGRRELVVEESSLNSHGACTHYAAGLAEAKSSLERESSLAGYLDLRSEPTVGGIAENLLASTLARGGRFVTARTPVAPYLAWGDGRALLKNRRNPTDRQYARVDLSSAPTGADAPLYDIQGGPTVGDKRLYIALGERPSFTAASPEGFELNKALALRWDFVSGTSYRLQIGGLQAPAGPWAIRASSTTQRTAAELANPHLIALMVKYESAGIWRHTAYHMDQANGAVELCTGTTAAAFFHTSGDPFSVYLNAALSTGASTFTNPAGFSDDYDIGYFAALKEFDETDVTGELDAIGLAEFPFRRYGDLALLTNFGQLDPGDATLALVRYAYGQTARASAYDCDLSAKHLGYAEVATALPAWRSYSWLLGERRSPRKLGQNQELAPSKATLAYGGAGRPIEVEIQGQKTGRRATDFLLQTLEATDRAAENARGAN